MIKLKFLCFFIVSIISVSSLAQSNEEPTESLLGDDLEVIDSLIVTGALDIAIKHALELNGKYPENTRLIRSLIFSYTALGMTDHARFWLNQNAKNQGSDYKSHLFTYLDLVDGQYQGAKKELENYVVAADSLHPEIWYRSAPLAFHLGDYEKVIHSTEMVMDYTPERKNLTALYGFALMQKGKVDIAKKILSKHKRQMQNNIAEKKNVYDSHLNLAKIAAIESDADKVVFHLDKYMGDFIPDFIHYFLVDEPAYTFWDNIRDEASYQTFFEAKENRIQNMKGNLEIGD